MTFQEALIGATQALKAAGIEGAARDARVLLAHAAGLARDRLTLHLPDDLSAEAQARLQGYITRRVAHEPVAKIIGYRGFWGRDFRVTADVLDPRPETETLIAAALEGPEPKLFLDLGTGSGVLAVTLLCEWPDAMAVATDISQPALDIADENARRHAVSDRLTLLRSDWFERVAGQFDLIVSNPPYIAADEMAGLSEEVRAYDPHLALSDQGDGLSAYRAILAEVCGHLTVGGRMMVEIGWQQGQAVSELFQRAGFQDVRCLADLEGRDRVVLGIYPG